MKTIANIEYVRTPVINHLKPGTEARRQRQEKGITLTAIANAMGLSKPYLSDLALGRRNWTIKRMRHFEHTLASIRG